MADPQSLDEGHMQYGTRSPDGFYAWDGTHWIGVSDLPEAIERRLRPIVWIFASVAVALLAVFAVALLISTSSTGTTTNGGGFGAPVDNGVFSNVSNGLAQ